MSRHQRQPAGSLSTLRLCSARRHAPQAGPPAGGRGLGSTASRVCVGTVSLLWTRRARSGATRIRRLGCATSIKSCGHLLHGHIGAADNRSRGVCWSCDVLESGVRFFLSLRPWILHGSVRFPHEENTNCTPSANRVVGGLPTKELLSRSRVKFVP